MRNTSINIRRTQDSPGCQEIRPAIQYDNGSDSFQNAPPAVEPEKHKQPELTLISRTWRFLRIGALATAATAGLLQVFGRKSNQTHPGGLDLMFGHAPEKSPFIRTFMGIAIAEAASLPGVQRTERTKSIHKESLPVGTFERTHKELRRVGGGIQQALGTYVSPEGIEVAAAREGDFAIGHPHKIVLLGSPSISGKGTFTWPDGSCFVGNWQDGLQHGPGMHILADRTIYTGEWHLGNPIGIGTFIFPNGESIGVEYSPAVEPKVKAHTVAENALVNTRSPELIIPRQTMDDLKPFKLQTDGMSVLRFYESHPIPRGTTILLSANVFDGIGDLEHVIQAAKHLKELSLNEPFDIAVLLDKGYGVPLSAWEEKLALLKSVVPETYAYSSDPQINGAIPSIISDAEAERFNQRFKGKPLTPIGVSFEIRDFAKFNVGRPRIITRIEEYFHRKSDGNQPGCLSTGLSKHTVGVWMNHDPSFFKVAEPFSIQAIHQIYGGDHRTEPENWSVGFASLRTDEAKLLWMDTQLHTVPIENSCSLVVGVCKENQIREYRNLAVYHGYTRLEVVQVDGSIQKIEMPKDIVTKPDKILRVVHQFVEEEDRASLLHRARAGTIGGRGDTAFAQGLSGRFPGFAEDRPEKTLELVSKFFELTGYPLLAEWYQNVNSKEPKATMITPNPFTPELMDEWNRFQKDDLPRLNVGPWFTLAARRAALASASDNAAGRFLDIENDFVQKHRDFERYKKEMEELLADV
jgi:hypothetical protein